MPADRLLIFVDHSARPLERKGSAPRLTRVDARELYTAMLRDVVALAARERGRVELWTTGGTSGHTHLRREFPHLVHEDQAHGTLGFRIADAFDRSFVSGAERVVILTRETPTLREATLTMAFKDLHDADVVLAPTLHGGTCLAGARASAWPRARALFDVAGDAAHAWETAVERSAAAGLELRVLPGWYAIETAEDLLRARGDASADSHLGRWLAGPGANVVS